MESQFKYDSIPQVEPDHWSDGVPVFTPCMDDFCDFYRFNKAINRYGMELGIVKIIPPMEWTRALGENYKRENIDAVRIRNPIVQHINGSGAGIFSLQNIERPRTYNMYQWKELSRKGNFQPPAPKGKARTDTDKTDTKKNEKKGKKVAATTAASRNRNSDKSYLDNDEFNIDTSVFTAERCCQLEKVYWKSLTYAEPMYGADTAGSLFSDSIKSWNVAHLPNILDLMDTKLPGVNDAYLYAGLWKATFSWHLEDQDLYSINYLHFGAPKQWYSIPQKHSTKFYNLMADLFPEEKRQCLEFLRHKTFLVSPHFLSKNGIQVNKIVHREGEFMITFPYGYHAGFNYGYNLAESVNFALDEWFPFGKVTKKCECISDSVGINVEQLYCKYKGIPYVVEEEPELTSDDDDCDSSSSIATIQDSHRGSDPGKKHPIKKKSRAEEVLQEQIKKIEYECCLCPNNLPRKLTKTKVFELYETDLVNERTKAKHMAHYVCANMFPTQLTVNAESKSITGMANITTAQKNLKCQVCEPGPVKSKKIHPGVCFQCVSPKCVRAFHATCALGSGTLLDYENSSCHCKSHRPKKQHDDEPSAKQEVLQKIPLNCLIFFTFHNLDHIPNHNRDIFCGYVLSNNTHEDTFDIAMYPKLKEKVEVQYRDVFLGSPDDNIPPFTVLKEVKVQARPRFKKFHSPTVDDGQVTGIKNNKNLIRSVDGNFITETFYLQHVVPLEKCEGECLFWYNLPTCSTDQVARYTSDIYSQIPNDSNYIKFLQRKATRNPNDYANDNTIIPHSATKRFKLDSTIRMGFQPQYSTSYQPPTGTKPKFITNGRYPPLIPPQHHLKFALLSHATPNKLVDSATSSSMCLAKLNHP